MAAKQNELDPTDFAPVVGGVVTENQSFDSSESTIYNWDYGVNSQALRRLYELGKNSQWNATQDLDWDTDVDLEQDLFEPDAMVAEEDWFKKLTPRERTHLVTEINTQTLSQFLHGEQGALIATSQLVGSVPDMDGKFYAATQVVDEARHVEVFSRYVREKTNGAYDITESLFGLLKSVSAESRWDFKFLGMQLLVEGLALAAFINMSGRCKEPLLKRLLRLVMQDEARHVAYGVLSLRSYYDDMEQQQRRERQEFVYEATIRMRDRLFSTQAHERVGIGKKLIEDFMTRSEQVKKFRTLMFVNVVPNMKKIGLLNGFLEQKFGEMGILALQDFDSDALLQSYIAGDNSPAADRKQP
ncbi:MAG: ferritin-like domain-containing protein [SAR324 cluster bacterium]|nr:ferritin-like domain-containing protein [SAR324 cluster bacterium]MCZ6532119.1 ferritin-like domain-containing protein [SAR324 cluster bacterium]MCZ6557053.1 ferritin-like domain-containing protein [SAR324 cluster bacterium]MCZ6647006.1 ferritin-like domain-containing protein [SAR324 cluster bacterium]MCZ6843700.1 ferritin-like domain-containing protein [SAR324 cluster bacterium]